MLEVANTSMKKPAKFAALNVAVVPEAPVPTTSPGMDGGLLLVLTAMSRACARAAGAVKKKLAAAIAAVRSVTLETDLTILIMILLLIEFQLDS